MFEEIGRLAEKAATNVDVSRRGFLRTAAKGAGAVAALVGGLLLFPQDADAGRNPLCADCLKRCRAYGYSPQVCRREFCYPQCY